MKFDGRVVMAAGAARGIGRTACRHFLERGAKVAACDVNAEGLAEAARDLDPEGRKPLLAVVVDVLDWSSVARAVAAIESAWGPVDVLVNYAGIACDVMLHKLREEDFDRVLDVNLKGVFHCTQAVAPAMRERGRGAVVNTASVVGRLRKRGPDELRRGQGGGHRHDADLVQGAGAQGRARQRGGPRPHGHGDARRRSRPHARLHPGEDPARAPRLAQGRGARLGAQRGT